MIDAGIGYRHELSLWVDSRPPALDFLELPAEEFARPELQNRLAALAALYPVAIRSCGLSLGTPGPMDEAHLSALASLAAVTEPLWISEPIAFSRSGEIDLACANPVRPDEDSVETLAGHAREIAERCGVPLLLETIASHIRIPGTMTETAFLNRLCDASGCGLLLDLTALYVDSRNHGFDPLGWLYEIDPAHIRQLHVSGFSRTDDLFEDLHEGPVGKDVWELVDAALTHAPVHGATIEYDSVFPAVQTIESDLRVLKDAGGPAA
jgi:uncharacterized protein